ncbi:hypothetical protein OsJ_29945 [Oryza sativa Japonica Group]|uniref:Uncharacterized protein n=1 Tax=Oryza sativa subsp. japonica TaxID=39947 RepID=B9G4G7_ORYSJ|nr:hypothetical protein OsJ_29945 [Oryza sativa Japonica Group]
MPGSAALAAAAMFGTALCSSSARSQETGILRSQSMARHGSTPRHLLATWTPRRLPLAFTVRPPPPPEEEDEEWPVCRHRPSLSSHGHAAAKVATSGERTNQRIIDRKHRDTNKSSAKNRANATDQQQKQKLILIGMRDTLKHTHKNTLSSHSRGEER